MDNKSVTFLLHQVLKNLSEDWQKSLFSYLASGVVQLQISFSISAKFLCQDFQVVAYKKQILEVGSTKIGPIPDLAFAIFNRSWHSSEAMIFWDDFQKKLRVLWEQSSYVVLFWFAFLNPNSNLLGSSLPAFEALNFKPWVRKYSVDLDRTATSFLSATFHPVTTKIRFWIFVCGGKISHIKYHNLWRQRIEVIKLSTIRTYPKLQKKAEPLELWSISFESKLSVWGPC